MSGQLSDSTQIQGIDALVKAYVFEEAAFFAVRVSAVLMISVNRESEDGWIWKRMAESEDERRRALPRPLHRGPYPRGRSRSGEDYARSVGVAATAG